MKYRKDFVTNSSSSSFIIAKKCLAEDQLEAIRKHEILGEKLGIDYSHTDPWRIEENEDFITGYTDMDNFSFEEFFEKIGVNSKSIHWDDIPFDIYDYQEEEPLISDSEDWRDMLRDI